MCLSLINSNCLNFISSFVLWGKFRRQKNNDTYYLCEYIAFVFRLICGRVPLYLIFHARDKEYKDHCISFTEKIKAHCVSDQFIRDSESRKAAITCI